MSRLLKLQLRNIFHNKLFYVCLGISILMSVGVTFITMLFGKTPSTTTAMQGVVDQFSSGVDIIIMIFITLFCTFDFSEGTTKNIVARGYSKIKLLLSKYISSFIGAIIIVMTLSILSFALYIKNGLGFESSMLLSIPLSLVKMIAYTVLYGTIAFVLEKTSSSIIANMFVPNIITLVLGIADSNLKVNMSKYWIDNVSQTFQTAPTFNNMIFPLIMFIIYIVVIAAIGMYITKNKEIK